VPKDPYGRQFLGTQPSGERDIQHMENGKHISAHAGVIPISRILCEASTQIGSVAEEYVALM
jgi:hypothetical protein